MAPNSCMPYFPSHLYQKILRLSLIYEKHLQNTAWVQKQLNAIITNDSLILFTFELPTDTKYIKTTYFNTSKVFDDIFCA